MPVLASNQQPGLGAAVPLEDISEVRSALPGLTSLLLESLEFRNPARNLQVRGSLAAIARGMGQREVVLSVETVLYERIDVVDVELALCSTKSIVLLQMKQRVLCRSCSRRSSSCLASSVSVARYFDLAILVSVWNARFAGCCQPSNRSTAIPAPMRTPVWSKSAR